VNTTVTVGNQDFDLEVVATTIPRPTVAVERLLHRRPDLRGGSRE
jgi:hypothetical protein